jgi:hypothetical protein
MIMQFITWIRYSFVMYFTYYLEEEEPVSSVHFIIYTNQGYRNNILIYLSLPFEVVDNLTVVLELTYS